MHITILCFSNPDEKLAYSTKTLRLRAKEMGHEVKILRKCFTQMDFTNCKRKLLYKNKPFTKTDVVIVRPGFNLNYDLDAGTIKHFEYCGFTVVNKHLPVIITKNKIRTIQYLEYHNIPIPKTLIVHNTDCLQSSVNKIGKFPIIIKSASGSQGKGVMMVPNQQTMSSVMDVLMAQPGQEYMIQEYVKEAKGKDIRVFIVGGKIIAAMERVAKKGEFRSNFHLGGSVKIANLSHAEKSVALKAARVIGIEICGVDILRTKEGPKIIEVNSNPGMEGIFKATGIDVAGAIIKYSLTKARIAKTKKNRKMTRIKDKITGFFAEKTCECVPLA